MARSDFELLARELGGDPPETFHALPQDGLASLTAALRAARARQKKQLDEALTKALEHVPALMRLPVRKVLGL
ncbi:hypothetical protein DFR24_2835 [Panacagrimonas perspica]|jgi:hypothetical protein|uniref:Uncharacterized protein n=1 Tax=Panacagrimonas perspica TaxID=381431 RepID=A0A4R7P3V8_9GAMM|nr:hypothetical protein [Panacagrimonas perspica]TDU28463.1 hypothetical protein DFR24_2835 [Panacagrimonas perspica]